MPRLTPSTAHPLQTLREYTDSLEAAILVFLAKPDKKAVHKLRTSTRRIEALLELLAMLPNLPPHKKESRKAGRVLRKIRRAAGHVRDLDVQRDLVAAEASGKNREPLPCTELRNEARSLRRDLKRSRDDEAAHLQHLLGRHRIKFPRVFEKLLSVLEPAESLALPETELTSIVRDWYTQHTPSSAPQDHAQLHSIRKRAKLARYLAESAPESASSAHRLAARFEDLQQAGGQWHDWLLLQELSAEALGKSAKLPQRFAAHADDALRAYRRRLSKHALTSARASVP
jgi:CHAD domain-containing protein